MRTLSPEGPLDIYRRVRDEAEGLDMLLAECEYFDDLDADTIKDWIDELDRQHPLLGEAVVVYGTALTISMDEDGGVHPLAVAPDRTSSVINGEYCGFVVCTAYDSANDEATNVLAHMVKTGVESYVDEFKNVITKEIYSYVCVWGSEVVAKRPKHTHSLWGLQGDEPTAEFDRLAFDPGIPRAEVIRRIGRVANRLFINTEFDQFELNQQRVSYLNSLELLEGVVIVTRDIIINRREDYLSGRNIKYSDGENTVSLRPYEFDILPGYDRKPEGGILLGGAPELFVTAELENGDMLLIPLKTADVVYESN